MKTILGRPANKRSAKSTYPELARKVAEAITARMVQDYEDSVRRHLEHYDEPPKRCRLLELARGVRRTE